MGFHKEQRLGTDSDDLQPPWVPGRMTSFDLVNKRSKLTNLRLKSSGFERGMERGMINEL